MITPRMVRIDGVKTPPNVPRPPGLRFNTVWADAETAEDWAARDETVVLVRRETSPEDIGGMHAAKGILTALGGMTSHAAVVARGMGTCCVAGCGAAQIDAGANTLTIGTTTLREGDWISLDGSTGEVMLGQVRTRAPELDGNFHLLMAMADRHRHMGVRTNADTPHDAQVAREFGAQGIGLCRTEHMFFEETRIRNMRHMILADSRQKRERALAELLPAQREDFVGIFRAMDGLPVTIRLLDPPLHEFLPHEEEARREIAADLGTSYEKVVARCRELQEFNPMLGHRGCRLAITYPEIVEMQGRAIAEAACDALADGVHALPEVMVPLVGTRAELAFCAERLRAVFEKVEREKGRQLTIPIGTIG